MNSKEENPFIVVIFRSCDIVNAVNNAPRPFDLDKKTMIKICFKSLWNALQGYNYKIIVLGDNLSQEMKDFFANFDIELQEGIFGNDKSIRETIKIAQQFNDTDWVYFCEDDYLHKPNCFEKIVTLIKEKETIYPGTIKWKQLLRKRHLTLLSFPRFFSKPGLVIHPCDYPDRYETQYSEKNFIFHTSNSHWRQISDTTFTFLMQVKDIKDKRRILLKSSFRANDRYLSTTLYGKSFFFKKMLCVSPIPTLTSHMHTQTLSPFFDHLELITQLKKEI